MNSTDPFIHPSAIIDEGCEIASGVKVWHFCHLMRGCRIGEGSTLGQNVMVASNVVIGKNVKVQNNVSLFEGVTCEDDVFIGPSAVFTNIINPRSAISRKGKYLKTTVRKGATIGANATIICGNEIGAYAFVGAGAVVTRSIAPYGLVVGNPAEQIGWISEYGQRLQFNDEMIAECSESGEKYQLTASTVKKLT